MSLKNGPDSEAHAAETPHDPPGSTLRQPTLSNAVARFVELSLGQLDDAVLLIVTQCAQSGDGQRWRYELHTPSDDTALSRDEVTISGPVTEQVIVESAGALYHGHNVTLLFTAISPSLGYATARIERSPRNEVASDATRAP